MRPLVELDESRIRSLLSDGIDPTAHLLDRYGPYCHVCERPMWERAFVWDARSGDLLSPRRPGPDTSTVLLICASCAAVQANASSSYVEGELALPFDAVLALPSPRPDQAGRIDMITSGPGFAYSGPIVQGMDYRAARTVAFFDLNNGFEDIRTRLRIQAAARANESLERLGFDRRPSAEFWTTQAMQTGGFFSTWLTVLSSDQRASARLPAMIERWRNAAPGFFPGTDWDRLLGTR